MNENLKRLRDKRILVVEDEFFITDETRALFQSLGAIIVGPVSTIKEAIDLSSNSQIDAAILDVKLDIELVCVSASNFDPPWISSDHPAFGSGWSGS